MRISQLSYRPLLSTVLLLVARCEALDFTEVKSWAQGVLSDAKHYIEPLLITTHQDHAPNTKLHFFDDRMELSNLYADPDSQIPGYSSKLRTNLIGWDGRIHQEFHINFLNGSLTEGFYNKTDFRWHDTSLPFVGDYQFPMMVAIRRTEGALSEYMGRPVRVSASPRC